MVRDRLKSFLRYKVYVILSFVFLHVYVACKSEPKEKRIGYEVLIEPQELDKMIEEGIAPVIIEVGKQEAYTEAHIPGAFNLWRPDYGDDESYEHKGMRASKEKIESLLGSLGILPKDRIVLYDNRGDVDAARLYWLLKLYGHEKISLLNGGKRAWILEGRRMSRDLNKPQKSNYMFPLDNAHFAIEKEEVLAALAKEGWLIIDARTRAEYIGEELKKGAKKAGRIPGSIHLDWIETVRDKLDFRFKGEEELAILLEQRNIQKDKEIITYCHTGVRSAHLAYVLSEIMGFERVYNYDGSWIEWSHDDDLPFETDLVLSLLLEEESSSCETPEG